MTGPTSGAERVHAFLLLAYPARFRARFGAGMRDAFLSDREAARTRGYPARVAFWALTIVDGVRFGLTERLAPAYRRCSGTIVRWLVCWRVRGFGSQNPGAGQPRQRTNEPTSRRTIEHTNQRANEQTMQSLYTVDLRDAWRSLRGTPVVTSVAILSLALGMGANTALFSILNSLVLKSLPVRHAERLVVLDDGSWTNPIWEEIRARQGQLGDGAFAWSATRFDVSTTAERDFVNGVWASGRMFEVLGIEAVRGRTFTEADDIRGGGPDGPVAVISYGLWERRFGGATDVVGRTITIERTPFTIIGVTRQGFFGPDVGRAFDVAIPIGTDPLVRGKESRLDGRSTWWLEIMLRLRDGQTAQQATGLVRDVQGQIRAATLPTYRGAEDRASFLHDPLTFVPAASGRSSLRGRFVQPLTVILIVVGLVLLIACANIASLLLARAVARRHEFSLRLALGASRFRLSRQLLVESAMLAGAGALLGLGFAQWGGRGLVSQLTTLRDEVYLDLSLDWRVLAFTMAVTTATVVVFGLAPALGVSGVNPHDALKEQGRGVTGDRRMSLRHLLVVVQVALSLTLVVGAGLFARTLLALTTRDVGFNRDPVLIVDVNVQKSAVASEQRLALFERLRQAAGSVPGVGAAAVSFTSPVGSSGWNEVIALPASAALSRRQRLSWVNAVSAGWFSTYGIHMTAGRDFDDRDRAGAPRVAVVSRAFARKFLKGGNPVGQHFVSDPDGVTYDVVGLVEDAIYRSLRAEMMPTMYIPIGQWERVDSDVVIGVRSAGGPPLALAKTVTGALSAVDANTSMSSHALRTQVDVSLVQERLLATLSVFFGGLALLLAGLGLYGVTSYAVNSRRTEIGIRMALGANASGVVRMILSRVLWLVAIGVAAGAVLSLWASHFVATLLYGIQPRDPVTLMAAALILTMVGAAAGWLPARRASRTDPTIVLRDG